MQRKTIKKVLRKKFDEWVNSIEDKDVLKLVKSNSIIAGGALTQLLLSEDVSDYDVYFTNKETAEAVARYYCEMYTKHRGVDQGLITVESEGRVRIVISSSGVASNDEDCDEEKEIEDFDPIFITSNTITLKGKVQLIIRFYGKASDIVDNFDFVHCTNYWESKTNKVHLNPRAVESILSKTIYYQGSLYPVSSVIRTRKFLSRGWSITGGEYLKMIFQCSKLNLSDPTVLEDQLIGVDAVYFNEFIRLTNKAIEDNSIEKVDNAYLVKMVDKVFGEEE